MSSSTASALRIAGAYVVVSVLWVTLSDRVLARIVADPTRAQNFQTLKAWGVVVATGAALYLFVRTQLARRRRLERELAAERARFRAFVEDVTDSGIFLLDAEGRVTTWNAGAEQMLGWKAEDILGKNFSVLFQPEDIAAGKPGATLATAAREGSVADDEALRVRKDGSVFHASSRIDVLRHADGSASGFACSLRDTKDRQRAGAVLAESERFFRAIFEQAAVGIAQVARDGRMLRANPHFCALLGRASEDVHAHAFDELIDPEQPTGELTHAITVLEGGIPKYTFEKRFARPDGGIIWVSFDIALVRDAGGATAYFVVVAADVSPRRIAEEALATTAKQYRLMFALNPLPMLLYDLETLRILAVNDAMISSYGYSRGEFLRMNMRDIRPVEDVSRFLQAVGEVRAGRSRTPIEGPSRWRHRCKDGTVIHVEIASHVVDFEGRPAEIVLAHDVTARLHAEAELEESRARLAGIIDSAMDAIITIDAEQRVVLFNRAAETMFGFASNEMIGSTIDRLIGERYRSGHREHIAHFADTNVTSRRMGHLDGITGVRASGEEFPIEASISQVATKRGRFFTVILRDITERRRAEAALAESRHRLQIAVDSARLGFWEWEFSTNRVFFSPEMNRQLGLGDTEMSGEPEEYWRRVHPDDAALVENFRADIFESGRGSAEIEVRVRHKNDSYRNIQVSATLLRDPAGRPLRVLGTALDITPIRDTERTVRRLSAHILRLQDTERRRIARELHDTTAQNLAALNMNLARLGRALAAADPKLTRLVEDSTALADICVQEVRTLSYLLHPPLLDEFGLDRAVRDYVEGFSQRSGIDITVQIDGDIGRLPDEVELSFFRVLQESLGNVHRHSGSSAARVHLSRDATTVTLEVRDSGRGIPPAALARLRNRAALGVGISGMSERLQQIGGRLEFDSSSGGTIVRAIAPLPA